MLQANSFIRMIGDNLAFKESWFDRCIARYDDYIPSFPFWKPELYSPGSWIKEGVHLIMNHYHKETIKRVIEFAKNYDIHPIHSYFDNDEEGVYKPTEEAGWNVYSVTEFLNIDHKKEEYQAYVYYGSSIVIFDTTDKFKFYEMVQAYLNRNNNV